MILRTGLAQPPSIPQFPTDLAYQLFVIKGAKEAKSGEVSLESVGLQTPDSETLIVELEQPIPYFLELLTFPSFFPVCKNSETKDAHWAESLPRMFQMDLFVFANGEHSNKIEVVRNAHYWDAKQVQLRGIEMVMVTPEAELRMFQDHQLDWAGSPLSTLPPDAVAWLKESNDLCVKPSMGTCFLRVNTLDILSSPTRS